MQGLPPLPMGLGPNIVPLQSNIPPSGIVGPMGLGPLGYPNPVGLKPPGLQVNPNFNQNNAEGLRQRIKHIVKDKANFINSNQDTSKRLLS